MSYGVGQWDWHYGQFNHSSPVLKTANHNEETEEGEVVFLQVKENLTYLVCTFVCKHGCVCVWAMSHHVEARVQTEDGLVSVCLTGANTTMILSSPSLDDSGQHIRMTGASVRWTGNKNQPAVLMDVEGLTLFLRTQQIWLFLILNLHYCQHSLCLSFRCFSVFSVSLWW